MEKTFLERTVETTIATLNLMKRVACEGVSAIFGDDDNAHKEEPIVLAKS